MAWSHSLVGCSSTWNGRPETQSNRSCNTWAASIRESDATKPRPKSGPVGFRGDGALEVVPVALYRFVGSGLGDAAAQDVPEEHGRRHPHAVAHAEQVGVVGHDHQGRDAEDGQPELRRREASAG